MNKHTQARLKRIATLIPDVVRQFIFKLDKNDPRTIEQQFYEAKRLNPDRFCKGVILTACDRD